MDDENATGDPAALIEAYYAAGVTDGFPVVPPSDTSIADMLAGADLRGDEVVGQIHGRNARVTADKVALNAVMAGCRRILARRGGGRAEPLPSGLLVPRAREQHGRLGH